MTGIVCAGNWIVDIIHTLDRWPAKSDLVRIVAEVEGVGGGAANVALDLAALGTGLPVYPAGLIGQDRHADTVRRALAAGGLPDAWLHTTDRAATAHTHVLNLPGDSRTFLYHGGANDLLEEGHVPVEPLAARGARFLYLGYLNLLGTLDSIGPDGRTGAAHLLARARAAGMTTCVDLVSIDGPGFRPTVAATLPAIDYLFLNEIEAARATGLPVAGADDVPGLTAAGQALLAGGVTRAVVLHTAALALWLPVGGPPLIQPAPAMDAADIVSPVGAGDAFCAGVLYGLHDGWTPDRCLTLGQRAAAATLRVPTATGGIPPLATLMPPGA
jgi:sugar/nucleoside kinase (ribokinase family)